MSIRAFCVYLVLVLGGTSMRMEEGKATEEENTILTLVLKHSYPNGGYTVVRPETSLRHSGAPDSKKTKQSIEYIKEHLGSKGDAVSKLVERLYARNQKGVWLSLKSSPADGFLIDYDGKYRQYFEKDGGGWEKWYKDNPKALGITTVSLPVYDQESGLVLVYMGTQVHWLNGEGYVILYRYEKGALKELSRVMMWVS